MSQEEDNDKGDSEEKREEPEEVQNVSVLCDGFRQPSSMVYDADPDGWSLWSAVRDDDDDASGFSSALQIEWFDSHGAIFCCDTHNNCIMSIQSDNRAYLFAGGEIGHYDGEQFEAQFRCPCGIAIETNGAVLVADTGNHCIRRIYDGYVDTLAGSPRMAGDQDGFGDSALLTSPCGVAYDDADGSVYIADTGNSKIKRITKEGVVETVAGSGNRELRDGVGIDASFHKPFSLVKWRQRLLVADTGNHAIREIDLNSMRVRTIIGTGEPGYCEHLELFQLKFPNSLCIRENNTGSGEALLWIADSGNSSIHELVINEEDDLSLYTTVHATSEDKEEKIHIKSNSLAPQVTTSFINRKASVSSISKKKMDVAVKTQTKVLAVKTLLGGEDEDDEAMRHGKKNGVFEVATMEQPMGLAFNTMLQRLYCSDYVNNDIRQMEWEGNGPVPLKLIEIVEEEKNMSNIQDDSTTEPMSPMTPLSGGGLESSHPLPGNRSQKSPSLRSIPGTPHRDQKRDTRNTKAATEEVIDNDNVSVSSSLSSESDHM